ncbi:MAG: carboxypeptidase-like regulatory domain-containing protein [Bacteroides sp.]
MRRIVLLVAMVVAWVAGALAQPRTVTGVVTSSEDGSTLPQLSVALKGSTQGVVTDLDGHYRITVPGSEAVLQFVYMGMETQEITVGDRTEINVVMQPVDKAIDQVVVVGYGSGKKISSTVGR